MNKNQKIYIENSKKLIDYFNDLCQFNLVRLYAYSPGLIANHLSENPDKLYTFYRASIANAVIISKKALRTKGRNLFILFNIVRNYDSKFMSTSSLFYEMCKRFDAFYSAVILYNYDRQFIDNPNPFVNKRLVEDCIRIYYTFTECVDYFNTFLKPLINLPQ